MSLPEPLFRVYFGNQVWDYLVSGIIFLTGVVLVAFLRATVMKRLGALASKTVTALDDLLLAILKQSVFPFLYYGALWLAVKHIKMRPGGEKMVSVLGAILLTYCLVRFTLTLIRFVLESWVRRLPNGPTYERQVQGLMPIFTIAIWAIGILLLMDNLGVKVSALVAGLGIGGVAIALASQTVLGDLFSYFAILFDRPFEIDDFVIVDDVMGTIERIGIKTTRLRSLGGEQIIVSNSDLTHTRLRNYKRMQLRRIVFKLGVTYETPSERLKAIPELIRGIITRQADVRFDRAHFSVYGDFSLIFEVVYFVLSADYNRYMDIQQSINFAIKEEFERLKVDFAYPTQTVFLVKPTAPESV
jgi:small-conductance mechanosensitive channel